MELSDEKRRSRQTPTALEASGPAVDWEQWQVLHTLCYAIKVMYLVGVMHLVGVAAQMKKHDI